MNGQIKQIHKGTRMIKRWAWMTEQNKNEPSNFYSKWLVQIRNIIQFRLLAEVWFHNPTNQLVLSLCLDPISYEWTLHWNDIICALLGFGANTIISIPFTKSVVRIDEKNLHIFRSLIYGNTIIDLLRREETFIDNEIRGKE